MEGMTRMGQYDRKGGYDKTEGRMTIKSSVTNSGRG